MIEIVAGFISGMISSMGMGGGAILILCLTLFLSIDQKVAQATNLIFFIPTAMVSIGMHIKNKKINFKISKIIITAGIVGCIIGSSIAQKIEVRLLKKIFGIFLSLISLHEIYVFVKEYNFQKKNNNKIKKN